MSYLERMKERLRKHYADIVMKLEVVMMSMNGTGRMARKGEYLWMVGRK